MLSSTLTLYPADDCDIVKAKYFTDLRCWELNLLVRHHREVSLLVPGVLEILPES